MSNIRISAVSYLNTAPFLYGLQQSPIRDQIELTQDSPVQCAEKITKGAADIGLVPVVSMINHADWLPITNWGIAADGLVASVCLVGQVPIEEMDTIFLDYQSKTSNQLLQILCDEQFDVQPRFLRSEPGYEDMISGGIGGLLIGDRALRYKGNFAFQYDLGQHWKSLTGYPFIFARWISNRVLEADLIKSLDAAFAYGVENKNLVIEKCRSLYPETDLDNYLGECIRYHLEPTYLKGLDLFLKKLSLVEQNI
ncbi:MAG: menaquinone biosynthesis protein [Saprospiraceae bacterium]|nr:menaquinone biosynthesis protein [Saprospiraceae bacterium]